MSNDSSANILGVKVSTMGFSATVEKIELLIENGKSSQIVTVNPEFVMLAQKDGYFRRILNQAAIATPDGAGLLWASKFLREPRITERVAGVDLVVELAKRSHEKGIRLFFLGGAPGVAEQAADNLRMLYRKSHIQTDDGGVINLKKTDPELINKIRKARPDVLFVAFGFPKQDKWIYQNLNGLNVGVAIGVGGSFDYISGKVRRAPDLMQKLRLEWLYRMIKQPSRIGRIFTAVVIFPCKVFASRLFGKKTELA